MRLAMFDDGGGWRPGALAGSDGEGEPAAVLDLAALAASLGLARVSNMGEVLGRFSNGGDSLLAAAAEAVASPEVGRFVETGKWRLGPPIGPGGTVLCAGANYASHLAEMSDLSVPSSTLWFTKSPASVVASGEAIVLPRAFPSMVDYEGELAVVIGRRCHEVRPDEAMDYVGGYTLVNDVSARDWVAEALAAEDPQEVRAAWGRNLLGKQFPTFCPLGPVVLTADEVPDPGLLRVTTTVNGQVVQDAPVADLIVGIPELVSYLSSFFALAPGDVISTGSPPGVGMARTPPVFLAPGDLVEVSVTEIGVLSNPVVDSPIR